MTYELNKTLMRNALTIMALVLSHIIIGQTIQEKIETEVCKCFVEQEPRFNETNNLDVLDICFDKPFVKLESEIEAAIAKEIDTTASNAYELGMEYGRKLFNDMQEGLVYNCDSYYNVMQGLRALMHKNMRRDITEQKLDSLSQLVSNAPKDDNLLWERGAHNLALDNIEAAKSDFKQCLEINPDNLVAKFFLGWSYDLNSEYEKAIPLYEETINSTDDIGAFREIGKINLMVIRRMLKEQ
ncbi:MAG: hypothetical protein Aureis2KO_14840 [Aureisphaera sp.]